MFAEPRRGIVLEECRFYHTMEFPDGEVIDGDWDLRRNIEDYFGRVDVAGSRVLDVGTASGIVAFELEKRGADVVAADVASFAQYTRVPYYDRPAPSSSRGEVMLERMKNSFWYGWERFGSKAQCYYGDLFDLPPELGEFDTVFIGQILVHNRDPLGLLMSAAAKSRHRLVISEGMDRSDQPTLRFHPDLAADPRPQSYFRFSTTAMVNFLNVLGFSERTIETHEYRNNVSGRIDVPITTIVAERFTRG